MKAQQEIVPLFFKQSELVLMRVVYELHLEVLWEPGQIETECTARPGWYYVRHIASGQCDLVQWTDLKRADNEA
jgi:hypothetical protein